MLKTVRTVICVFALAALSLTTYSGAAQAFVVTITDAGIHDVTATLSADFSPSSYIEYPTSDSVYGSITIEGAIMSLNEVTSAVYYLDQAGDWNHYTDVLSLYTPGISDTLQFYFASYPGTGGWTFPDPNAPPDMRTNDNTSPVPVYFLPYSGASYITFDVRYSEVPLPGAAFLLATGLLGLAGAGIRARRRK